MKAEDKELLSFTFCVWQDSTSRETSSVHVHTTMALIFWNNIKQMILIIYNTVIQSENITMYNVYMYKYRVAL